MSLLVAFATCALPGTAFAATIAVDTTADSLGADGACSLREAIKSANDDAAPFSGAGECAPGNGTDDVQLPAGTFKLTIAGASEAANATGDLDILSALNLSGVNAASTTIDANHLDRALDVAAGKTVSILGITVRGGLTPAGANGTLPPGAPASADQTGTNGAPSEPGGGIRNAGSLTVTDCVITANATGNAGNGSAGNGGTGNFGPSGGGTGGIGTGGNGGFAGGGGGIYTDTALSVIRTVVSANTSGRGGDGGNGVGGGGGGATSNSGGWGGDGIGGSGGNGGNGGGIGAAFGAPVTIDQSTISGNATGAGGPSGKGFGGDGGVTSGTTGGRGGDAEGGGGASAGFGGGVFAVGSLVMSAALIQGNTTGSGGPAGAAFGGDGGAYTGPGGGSGGHGGAADGGYGGSAYGGGVALGGAGLNNVTITGNSAGSAADGAQATGGNGGGVTSTGTNGSGGDATGGYSGSSFGGAVFVGGLGNSAFVTHATVTGNSFGQFAADPIGIGGTRGNGGSSGQDGFGDDSNFSGGVGAGAFSGGLSLTNTIVSGNSSPSCTGTFTDGGQNISFPDNSCPGTQANPMLAALADNGGPTLTHALNLGSPALDAVPADGANCALTDQRGVARPFGPACDIGAFERATATVITGDATDITVGSATLNGNVAANASSATYHFEYGPTDSYGTATPDAGTVGTTMGPASAAITALVPGATYHYRLVATSGFGTAAGADRTFTATALTGPAPAPSSATKDKTAPKFLSASLKPKSFSLKKRKFTTIRFKLSEAAKVAFTVKKLRFSMKAKKGANKKKFNGKAGKRRLKPGRYRITMVAVDAAGNRSKPKRLAFTVKR